MREDSVPAWCVERSRFARRPLQICKGLLTNLDLSLVLPVPTAEQAKESGIVPTMQRLVEERLQFEEMDDSNILVTCENCQKKTFAVKWSEIT